MSKSKAGTTRGSSMQARKPSRSCSRSSTSSVRTSVQRQTRGVTEKRCLCNPAPPSGPYSVTAKIGEGRHGRGVSSQRHEVRPGHARDGVVRALWVWFRLVMRRASCESGKDHRHLGARLRRDRGGLRVVTGLLPAFVSGDDRHHDNRCWRRDTRPSRLPSRKQRPTLCRSEPLAESVVQPGFGRTKRVHHIGR